MIELMSPAGSYESLAAAIKAGANSVYFGVDKLNMRARSANFGLKDLTKVAKRCKQNKVKSYLTLNTVMYDDDLKLVQKICQRAKKAGVSAIIAADVAVMQYARSIGMEVHLSTQANVSNIEAVRFFSKFADVVVLARELTLEQIRKIVGKIKKEKICGPSGKLVRVELFIHGALCVSMAGKCYMSLASHNFSANRGACMQTCRRTYRVIDEENGKELVIDNKYVMSPKDLCTIRILPQILDAGVEILKIEGRGRSPEYVFTVTRVYRQAMDSYVRGGYNDYTAEKVNQWEKELDTVFNRGFWQGGYYLGQKMGEWSGTFGSKATLEKKYLGKVLNYFGKSKVSEVVLENDNLKVGDKISIVGPTTGVVEVIVSSIWFEDKKVVVAKKGSTVTISVSEKVRKNDKVYLMVERNS